MDKAKKASVNLHVKDAIENTKMITMTDSAVNTLMDFERVIDELNVYAFANWKSGELVDGPKYERYFVSCTFMWPYKKMPDPRGGERLLDYDCTVTYRKDVLEYPIKVKSPDDLVTVERHDPLLRAAIVEVLGNQSEEKIKSLTGREEIRRECFDMVNNLLTKEAGKALIVNLLFTSYLYD